jgi:hypothetical protein
MGETLFGGKIYPPDEKNEHKKTSSFFRKKTKLV